MITSNTSVAEQPGNVVLPASASGLNKDSVVNLTQLATMTKDTLSEPVGMVPEYLMTDVDAGLRLVMHL